MRRLRLFALVHHLRRTAQRYVRSMIPDGISKPDWDRLRKLAADAADAAARNDPASQGVAEELFAFLQQLRFRYGDLPSIVGEQILQEEFLKLFALHSEWRAFFEKQWEARRIELAAGGDGGLGSS